MSSPVEQIKERLDIVEVVSTYLRLEKAGANYRARCPFHQEKTPSFFVSPLRQSYHCFGCQRGGDIFSFVQEVEGLDFPGALKSLAERAGIELKPVPQREVDRRERLLRVMEEATKYYERQLATNSGALAYLEERGLSQASIAVWRLGWAADPPAGGWRAVTDFLLNRGFTEADLVESGMSVRSAKDNSRIFDRFRGRLMFPLFDSVGRVVAFSGRIFGQTSGDNAKYLNSPQTPLYDKSRLFYGYHRAKAAIRQTDICVLVEGQFDLILSHQAGVTNAVAVSGTALTEKHFTEPIKRLAKVLVMAFDGDAAGLAASRRAVEIALAAGFEVRLVALPAGQDPADLIKANPESWPRLVSSAKHVVDFFLGAILARGLPAREKAQAVAAEVLPLVARLTSQIDQAYFVSHLSQTLGLGEEVLWRELKKLLAKQFAAGGVVSKPTVMDLDAVSRRSKIEDKLAGLAWWQPTIFQSLLAERLSNEERERLFQERQAKQNSLIMETEFYYSDQPPDQLKLEAESLLADWQKEKNKERLLEVKQELQEAESRGDEAAVRKYLAELQGLSNRLKNVINNKI